MFGSVYLQSENQVFDEVFQNSLLIRDTEYLVLCPLTSFKLNPCLLISSTSLILQPLQNSAVNTLFELEKRGMDKDLAKEMRHPGILYPK